MGLLVSIETVFQGIEAMAVVIAVIFAIVQFRQYRREKRREACLELLHSFQSPSLAKGLNIVYHLPDELSKDQLEQTIGEDFHHIYALMATWESLGILAYRGELDLQLIDDFFGGPIDISWQKLKGHVYGERSFLNRETIGEWFQWLYERLKEYEAEVPPVGAHVAKRDWEPRKQA